MSGQPPTRLARLLLRLYPSAWRERYGNELLTLVDETGLTTRVAADLVVGALVERVRDVITVRRRMADAAVLPHRPVKADNGWFPWLVSVAMIAAQYPTITRSGGRRLPPPHWWMVLVYLASFYHGQLLLLARSGVRRAAAFGYCAYFFVEASALTCVLWMLGRGLAFLGVPEPGKRWGWLLAAAGAAWLVRVIYCGVRIGLAPNRWPGMPDFEIRTWRAVAFALIMTIAFVDVGLEFFLETGLVLSMFLRTTGRSLSRAGAARRQAAFALNQQRLQQTFPVLPFPDDRQ